ncbi:hypothetical protein PISMIDRAFT_655460 [Pisolithus microcarpus 441]|uniref:Helitron helicase-like domain-containing protein n=1 Tax=Pisolithus microcarpus 441 TaxID=765257 RepID=A0A0C9Z4R3_9AGAM|nr:hypothetical protein PISMIDRAFT_655460 [Pisolithus microcarpus 441]
MNIPCPNCHALHFLSEKLSNSSPLHPRFGLCCLQGQVALPPIQRWPRVLQDLFDDPQDQREFKKNVRQYNNALAFTSVGVEVDRQTVQGAGPASFRIHGTLHHIMGALMPPQGLQPSYAQLYIYDPQEATNTHLQRNPDLQGHILLDLHTTLREHHPYAAVYQQAHAIMQAKPPEQHTDVCMCLYLQQGTDGRRYNLPTVDEIAAIVPGDGSGIVRKDRDIILHLQGGGLHHISNLHPSYLPLHYVLLFPHGQEGWHLDIPLQVAGGGNHCSKKVTQTLWYAYCLHIHPPQVEPANLFKAGRLFNS